MSTIKDKLKTNKGFTLQDLIFALMAIMLFVGVIGSVYVSLYKVKLDTQTSSLATIYAIKMLEYMDKINYDKITQEDEEKLVNDMKREFSVPSSFDVSLNVTQYTPGWSTEDYVKFLRLSIKNTINEEENELVFEKIKVKEL